MTNRRRDPNSTLVRSAAGAPRDVGETFPTSLTDKDGVFHVLLARLDQIGTPVDRFEIVPVLVGE